MVEEVAVLPTAPKMDSWLGLYILSLNPPAASDIRDEQLGLNDQVINHCGCLQPKVADHSRGTLLGSEIEVTDTDAQLQDQTN